MKAIRVELVVILALGCLAAFEASAAEDAVPVARWSFEEVRKGTMADVIGNHTGTVKGTPQQASGVEGQALKFDGGLVSVPSAPALQLGDASFSIVAWVNPYELSAGQQMIVAKNVYSAGKREWGLMLDKDNRFRFYLSQKGWKTIASQTEPKAGHWHHVAITVEKGRGRLYVNGKQEAEGLLASSVTVTDAPLTIGGVQDGGHVTQTFHGALDEVALYRGALTPAAIAAMADKQTTPHKIEVIEPVKIWSGGAVPKAADLPLLKGAEFHVIKKQRPDADGCNWTLGVGLAWHKGKLYASYGFNKGHENTPTEESHVRASSDGGKNWGAPVVMDSGEGNLGVSHGVFLSHKDRLWAFMGAFSDKFQRTHTRAYTLNETTGAWEPHGVVVDAGFWPMQEPQKMADGNWIMAGARVSHGYNVVGDLPAVAISHGNDFTKWDMVVIPAAPGLGKIWGESTVIVEGKRIINISRYGTKPLALVSFSEDFGRTWTHSSPSNLPMATSKPYAGILSTGQRFLVCTTTADTGGRRSPLTIAVSKPGESTFSKVFLIRTSVFDGTPGVSDARADFSYPYVVEHAGKLYVGYTHKSHAANELAVIPVAALAVAVNASSVAGAEGLWVGSTDLSSNANIPFLKAEHRVIDECTEGEYQFTIGADIVFHGGEFIAQWANSRVEENDEHSLVRGRRSKDTVTWEEREVIAPGFEGAGYHSHGVFHSHEGQLWSFNPQHRQQRASNGFFQGLRTDAFLWKPEAKKWAPQEVNGLDAFWPLCKPVRLGNGKWIMAGAKNTAMTVLAAVAICDDNRMTKWRQVVIPHPSGLAPDQIWGETTVTVEGPRVLAIVRNRKKDGTGFWYSTSSDCGETWPELRESNIPHGGGRPMLGRLADGRHFLVSNMRTRNTLVLALAKPGTLHFDRIYRLLDKPSPLVRMPPAGAKRSQWGYPSAVEHDGKLYIVYSITKEATGLTVVDLAATR